jgi:IrrE N-terminal-like domain
MPKLVTKTSPEDAVAADEILETLLVDAGAAGRLPTNEKKLLKFLGLEQLSFDFAEDVGFLHTPEESSGELRAALHLGERVVATQSGLGMKRTRFSIFHEIGHCVLPEHHMKFFVDTDRTLSFWTKVRMEREANQFAADLLFQGKLFSEQAIGLNTSLSSIIELAPQYGASFEAAFRRYTESHVVPCALIVYDKVAQSDESFVEDDSFRVQYMVSSPSFRKRFFSGVGMSTETCRASEIYRQDFCKVGQVVENELTVGRADNEKFKFEIEVFNNGYKIFQFLKRPIKRATRA